MPPVGSYIKRLTPSKTARDIRPGDIGRVGGINPTAHDNTQVGSYDYFPAQWLRNGLWSALDPFDSHSVWVSVVMSPTGQWQEVASPDDED